MPKINLLLKWSAKFLSTLMNNIFAAIVLGLVTVPVLISWATGTLNILLQSIKSPTPLWATIALVLLLGVYFCIIIFKAHSYQNLQQPKYYKYCPECDYGIDAKRHEVFCSCGTKYLTKCPECNKKIIRDRGRICSFCGYGFPIKPRTGNEWMAR